MVACPAVNVVVYVVNSVSVTVAYVVVPEARTSFKSTLLPELTLTSTDNWYTRPIVKLPGSSFKSALVLNLI